MKNTSNNRVSPRKPLLTNVIFEDEYSEAFLAFDSTDISISGLFIESPITLQEKSKVLLRFAIDDDEPICVTGEVVRLAEEKRGPGRRKDKGKIGIGIRFLGLTLEDLKRIESYVNN